MVRLFKFTLVSMLLFVASMGYAQEELIGEDSVRATAFVQGRGTFQTGNLKQIGGGFIADLNVGNKRFSTLLSLSYDYVEVNGFNVINDSWNSMEYIFKPGARFYPVARLNAGFAKSFGIQYSYVIGAGGGMNITRKSPLNYMRFDIIGGYMDFTFDQAEHLSGDVIDLSVKGNTQLLSGKFNLNWNFKSFLSPSRTERFGFMNILRLELPLTKKLSISTSHTTIYNEQVDIGKVRLNTILMFGISYHQL